MTSRRVAALALAAALAGAAHAQGGVALESAWMRPVPAGQAQAAAYVDVRAVQPVTLVGASSPAARSVEFVLVDPPDPDPATHRVVAEFAVAADRPFRLAPGGSHLRLTDLRRDLQPGDLVPLELVYVDAAGRRGTARTEVLVRGLMIHLPKPQPVEPPR